MTIYARYEWDENEKKINKQLLSDHLIGTAEKIKKLFQLHSIKQVISQQLLQVDTDFNEFLRAVEVVALLHDLGKALHCYQKQISSSKSIDRGLAHISFEDHEVISAHLYVQVCLIYRNTMLQYPYIHSWLTCLSTQAIILHHQGLRAITLEGISRTTIYEKLQDNPKKSSENLKAVINEIKRCGFCQSAKTLLDIIEKNTMQLLTSYNPNSIQALYKIQEQEAYSTKVHLSRIVTACLMMADNWDAHQAIGGRPSHYIKEILDFVKRLNC